MEEAQLFTAIVPVIVGVVTAPISSVITWLLARKKYRAEVNTNIIENMQKSLDFYKQLSDDTNRRLQEVLERNDKLEDQIRDLQRQVFALMSTVCTNLSCSLREKDETILNLKNGKGISFSKEQIITEKKEDEDTDR